MISRGHQLSVCSGADMMAPQWHTICTPKLEFICDHMEGENGKIICLKVEQFVSRIDINYF